MAYEPEAELAANLVQMGATHAMSLFRHADLAGEHKRFRGDWVTRADREVEELIRARIAEVFPEDAVLGEEDGIGGGGGRRSWIIDPIDGTSNFVHGLYGWCTAVALIEDGQAVVSAAYEPLEGNLWTATRGGGTHLNGQPCRVDGGVQEIAGSLCYCVTSGKSRGEHFNVNQLLMSMTMQGVHPRPLGSGTLSAGLVACGRLQGWLQPRPADWDWYPGQLIMQEAGAVHCALDNPPGWHLFCPPDLAEGLMDLAGQITPRYPEGG